MMLYCDICCPEGSKKIYCNKTDCVRATLPTPDFIDFPVYIWPDETGRPQRCLISEIPFVEMPIEWVGRVLDGLPRYNNQLPDSPSVGTHSAGLAYTIRMSFDLPGEVRRYAMWHDVGEAFVGDVPSPLGLAMPAVKEAIVAVEQYILAQVLPIYVRPKHEETYGLVSLFDKAIRDVERGWVDEEDTPCREAKIALEGRFGSDRMQVFYGWYKRFLAIKPSFFEAYRGNE